MDPKTLFSGCLCNVGVLELWKAGNHSRSGCNSTPIGALSQAETRNMTQKEGIAYIKQVLNQETP